MITLDVNLAERSYPILIGSGLLANTGILDPYLRGRDVLIVTNEVVAPLYLEPLKQLLPDRRIETVVLPDGEAHKTLATVQVILDQLVNSGYGRDCTVISLGGGVVGDMAGFAAAVYQRGVNFIQVPTSLLAQVDSAVGGKTGVNHPGGKNLIGAFHQPRCVLTDTDVLSTLADRELSAGLAEVVKYGLIGNAEFLNWLNINAENLLRRDATSLLHAIQVSCEAKTEIVVADEREQGQRALLNLGHTFGHAIENNLGYGEWLHGEAVSAGMVMAADFSARLNWLSEKDARAVRDILRKFELPVDVPAIRAKAFLATMGMDKKVVGGQIRLVLLEALGDAVVTADYDSTALVGFLDDALEK